VRKPQYILSMCTLPPAQAPAPASASAPVPVPAPAPQPQSSAPPPGLLCKLALDPLLNRDSAGVRAMRTDVLARWPEIPTRPAGVRMYSLASDIHLDWQPFWPFPGRVLGSAGDFVVTADSQRGGYRDGRTLDCPVTVSMDENLADLMWTAWPAIARCNHVNEPRSRPMLDWVVERIAQDAQPPAGPPEIVKADTFRDGVMVWIRVYYADADGGVVGFGFRGANGSLWAEERHTFSSPSYGRVYPDRFEYPFNHGCGGPNELESDVEAWVFDARGAESRPVILHLACNGQ
jgi:hypothetical protein